jgi:hypothetical protein
MKSKALFAVVFSMVVAAYAQGPTSQAPASILPKFDPSLGTYCRVQFHDLFDATTLHLRKIAPQTYCLFDVFGVGRKPVLDILQKYANRTSVTADEAKEITQTLRVDNVINQLIEGQHKQVGSSEARYQLAQIDASLEPPGSPRSDAGTYDNYVAQEEFGLYEALQLGLGDLFLEIPGFLAYAESNGLVSGQTAQQLEAQFLAVKMAAAAIGDELCKHLECKQVAVDKPIVEPCPPGKVCAPKQPDCAAFYQKIDMLVSLLNKRYRELQEDKFGLPATGKMSIEGHQIKYRENQTTLRRTLNQADAAGCTEYDPNALEWTTRPPPPSP